MRKKYSLEEVLEDPVLFIARLKIKDKEGNIVSFGEVMTPEQIAIIKALQKYDRVAIIKARQMGVTTIVRAYMFWKVYTSHRTLNSVVVSNKQNSANELLKIDKRFFEKLPSPLRRIAAKRHDRITFESTDSACLAMSAQSDATDRGYTLNMVHASEYAFYDQPEEWLASTIASVNKGQIVLESTANHFGDALHKIATAQDDAWHVIFLPWSSFPEYQKLLHHGGHPIVWSEDEERLRKQHQLTDRQLWWRRKKIEEIKDERLFKREYPLSIEEAYQMADDNYFTDIHFENMDVIKIGGGSIETIAPYSTKDSYIMGVDLGGGTGGDYSVAIIISKLTSSPCAVLSSNKLSIHDFTVASMNLASRYKAEIAFETNNHGHAFKEILHQHTWHKYRAFTTTSKSKITIYQLLRTYLEEDMINYVDDKTFAELRTLIKHRKGLAPSAPDGFYDDRCMAYCIALYYLKDIDMPIPDFERWTNPRRAKQGHSPMQIHPLKIGTFRK
jgi:hypothetical protein